MDKCYGEVNQWLKDVDFLHIESNFLKKVLKEYIERSGLLSRQVVLKLEERLIQIGADIHLLRKDLICCHSKVELMAKDIIRRKRTEVEEDIEIYRNRIETLFKTFYEFKSELYNLSSQIIEEESYD